MTGSASTPSAAPRRRPRTRRARRERSWTRPSSERLRRPRRSHRCCSSTMATRSARTPASELPSSRSARSVRRPRGSSPDRRSRFHRESTPATSPSRRRRVPHAPIVFTAAPGATVTLAGHANGFVLSNKSWITVNGFGISSTTGVGISVQTRRTSSSRTTTSALQASRSAGRRNRGSTSTMSETPRVGQHRRPQHQLRDLPHTARHATWSTATQASATRRALRGQPPASGSTTRPATQSTRTAYITTRTPGSSRSRVPSDNLIFNNVSYDNGDHGIDDYASTGQRIIGNTVYKNVDRRHQHRGQARPAQRSRTTSASTTGSTSPRTHSDIRVDSSRRRARRWTTTSCT